MKNKRKHNRALSTISVKIKDKDTDVSIRFNTKDLSEGGIFLRSEVLWELGEILFITLPALVSREDISIKGEVVRTEDKYFMLQTESEKVHGMGIKFIEISKEEKEKIRELIDYLSDDTQ